MGNELDLRSPGEGSGEGVEAVDGGSGFEAGLGSKDDANEAVVLPEFAPDSDEVELDTTVLIEDPGPEVPNVEEADTMRSRGSRWSSSPPESRCGHRSG